MEPAKTEFAAGHAALVDLLQRVSDGDEDAFTTFYRLTSARVYSLSRRVIVDVEIAQDVVQEIYLIVWRDARKYNPVLGNPMAWLMTITHRRAIDKVRLEQAHINREARWGVANRSIDYDVVAETVADGIEVQSVIACLRSLSPLQRQAIELAYYNGLTYREVAEHLSVPLPTIKTRIRDGLKHLRACLSEDAPQ